MMELARATRWTVLGLLAICIQAISIQASAQTSDTATDFPARIDAWVTAATPGMPEFTEQESVLLRKLYLCLVGQPPIISEVDAYLADTTPDKYIKKVDELMARPEFIEHWAEKLDVMLMERRANTHIPQDQWAGWLRAQLASKRPVNQLMADLLVADGAPGDNRPSSRFLLDRTGDPHLITKDVARIYFGRDIQCSQCHNHPTIDSYLQTDYHGLFGFVAGVFMTEVADGDKKIQMIGEKSASDSPFESVFRKGTMHRVLPHLFGGEELAQPWMIPGEDYHPAEAGKPAKPIHSRREQLASAIRSGTVDSFNSNIANRLWAQVFGRGVVEPVDLFHADNPPLSEELLTGLTQQLVACQFDLRTFVRDLVRSKSFQRGQISVEADTNPASIAWLNTAAEKVAERIAQTEQSSAQLREKKNASHDAFQKSLSNNALLQAERLAAFANVDTCRAAYSQTLEALKKANAEKAAAEQAVNAANDKVAKLQAATDASAAALAAIGQDAELTAAVELLKTRTAAAKAATEPLQKAFMDKSTLVTTAQEASAKSKEALLVAQNSATEVNQRYQTASRTAQQLRLQADADVLAYANAELSLQQLKKYATWSDVDSRLTQLAQQVQQANNEVTVQKTNLAAVMASKQTAEQKLPEFVSGAETMAGQFAVNQQAVEELKERINRLATAKDALSASVELVGEPKKVSDVIEQLDVSLKEFLQQLENSNLELTKIGEASALRQNLLAQHKQMIAQLQEQSTAIEKLIADSSQLQSKCEMDIASARQDRAAAATSIAQLLGNRFVASQLRALTPEQIGWSFLTVNQVYKNYVDKHLAELEKAVPATAEQQADAQFQLARRTEAVRKARAELQGNINHFVTLYGAGPGQPQSDFFATPDQALYANNGGALFAWASPSNDNTSARVIAAANATDSAKILYRGILCREPTGSEIESVTKYLEQQPDQRARLVQEMAWSLMASAEFRFLP